MKLLKLLSVAGCSTLLAGLAVIGAPVITNFTPSFGASTDASFITISGSGFSNVGLIVRFNGVRDLTASSTTANQIQARVPAGATNGPGPIYVEVNTQGTYSANDFTVIGPGPYVTSFTPSGSGGTPVTINGAHFTSVTSVKFNGVNGTGVSAPTSTQITVNAPQNVTTGPITVTTTTGSYTTPANFFVPPAIGGFNPPAGRLGTNITVTGTNLLGATAIRFNNNVDAPGFTVLNNSNIVVAVPPGATTGPLRVIAPAGSAFSSSNFLVQPLITGFSPSLGPVGTSVTVSGANFNIGTPTVKFNGVAASSVSSVTFSSLVAVVPAGASSGPISVATTDGTAISDAAFYLPARITSFAPSNSAPGSLVSVTGTNFLAVSAVAFNGTPATAFYYTNNGSLGAIVPAGVTTGPISLTTPAGSTNSASRFYGAPVISSFNPTHGLPGNGVTLTGLNFLDASAVFFNGTNAAFAVVNNTTLTATVPNNAQTGPITVIAPAGTNTSAQSYSLDYTADLSANIFDSPDPVVVGSNIVYVMTFQNNGPFPSPNATFSATLVGPGVLVNATTTQGTLNTNSTPITGSLGSLPFAATAVVQLTVRAVGTGMITNTATVAGTYLDPVADNDTFVSATYVQPLPVLSIRRLIPNTVRIAWDAALTNYGLQFRTNLQPSGEWADLPTLPAIVGSEFQLSETNPATMRYYRLRRVP